MIAWPNKPLLQHPLATIISYILIILLTVLSMKAYLWYLTVQQTIRSNEQRKVRLEQEALYLRDFRLPYLESDYAKYFISHENGVANKGEQVIKLIRRSQEAKLDEQIISPSWTIKQASPELSGWGGFFQYKLQRINK